MYIFINGKKTEVAEKITIIQVIEMLGLEKNPNVVELNGKFVEFCDYSKSLNDEDRIFVRNFVGGG